MVLAVNVPAGDPCWPVDVFDDDEPEQAVTSRHRAPATPVMASPARRLLSRCRPVGVRSLSRTLVLLWYQIRNHAAMPTATASSRCGVLGRQLANRCRLPRVLGNAVPDLGR